jgi:hypothetical protein
MSLLIEKGQAIARGARVPRIQPRHHPGTAPLPTELIGRARESRALDDLLEAVRTGESRVLVLRGEPGVGKSALLQHLFDAASGFTVLHASGVESEMELPFAALHQLCASMVDRLDGLPAPQRDAAFAAFGLSAGTTSDRFLIGK